MQLFPFFENEESGSECDRKTLKIGLIDDIPIYLPQNRWLKLLVDFKKLPKNEKNKDNIPNEVFKNFGTVSGGSLCSNMRISGISNQQKAYIRRIYKDLQAKGLSLYCKIKVSKKFVVRLKKFSTIQDKAYDKGLKSIVGEKGLHAQLKRLLPKQSFFYEVVENLYMKGNPRFVFIGKNK